MPFYESITDYYDYIFPLNARQIDFIKGSVSGPFRGKRILDAGCGTGILALALAGLGFDLTAIDADEAMIEKAKEKAKEKAGASPPVTFRQADMRRLIDAFPASSFDLVLCFGNTLVHLTDLRDVAEFFSQARQILTGEGRLLLQIVNYDYVLDRGIRELPTIDNEFVRFERLYDYDASRNLLAFNTVLTVKETGRVIRNSIPLYPLRRRELEGLLQEAGFTAITCYGDFDRTQLKDDGLPLIVEAVKGRAGP